MRLNDALKISVSNVLRGKMRSVLTMLGIVIGIASVILLMSIGASAQNLILGQVQSIGSNLIFVIPGASGSSRLSSPASVQGIIIKTLVESDLNALKREPSVLRAAPEVRGQARIIFENNDSSIGYLGTTADYFGIRNFKTAKGYAFSEEDVRSGNRVVVLGSEIAETLFEDKDPIGKTVRLKDTSFRVTGVLESKGLGPFGVDQDNLVIVPVSIAQKQLLGTNYYNTINIEASPDYTIEFATSRITSILRAEHRITDPDKDDFTIRTQEDALDLLGSITSILTIFLTAISSISLVVGGIGIMNIMLVSVVERTKEIGLRKAVGATNRDILEQFLWEAVALTFVGGLIGIAFGAILTILTYFVLTRVVETDWSLTLPFSAILLAATVSTLTGIVFGLYPARQASRKAPVDALRYE